MSQLLLAPLERFFDGPADDEPDRKAIAATLERAFAGDDPRDRPYAALNFLQDLAARQAREQAGDRALEQKRLDEVPRDRQGPLFVGLSASGVDRDFYYRYRNDSPERLSELREQAQKEFAAQFPDLKFDDLHRAYYQARQSFNAAERIGARVKSLRDQGYTGEELEDRLPFLGSAKSLADAWGLTTAVERIEQGQDTYKDHETVAKALAKLEHLEARGLWEQVRDILKSAPGFMAEFAATGGAFSLGAKTGGKLAERVLTGMAEGFAKRALVQTASGLAGAALQAGANPQRTAEAAVQRLTPAVGLIDDDEQRLRLAVQHPDKSAGQAVLEGYADNLIEMGSERLGFIPAAALAKIPGVKQAGAKIAQWIGQGKPGGTAGLLSQLRQSAGFHGALGEMFEEAAGDEARFQLGLDKDTVLRNLASPDPKQRAKAEDELKAQFIAFALTDVALSAPGALNRARRRPDPTALPAPPPPDLSGLGTATAPPTSKDAPGTPPAAQPVPESSGVAGTPPASSQEVLQPAAEQRTPPAFDPGQAVATKLGHEPRRWTGNRELLEGTESLAAAIEATAGRDTAGKGDAVFVGLDTINQKGLNAHFRDDLAKADREVLAPAMEALRQNLAGIAGVKVTAFKQRGDEFGLLLTADQGKIDRATLAGALELAQEEVAQLLQERGIPTDLENPRARKPRYQPAAEDAAGQAAYAQELRDYEQSRGTGFRVGITPIRQGDTLETVEARISEQHTLQKKKGLKNVQGTTTESARLVAPEGQAGGTGSGAGSALGETAPGGRSLGEGTRPGAPARRSRRGRKAAAGTEPGTTPPGLGTAGGAARTGIELPEPRGIRSRGQGTGGTPAAGTQGPATAQLSEAQHERLERALLTGTPASAEQLAAELKVPAAAVAQVLAHLQAEGRLKPAGQGEAGEATYRLRRKPAKKFQLRDEGAESERRKILAEKQARGEGPRTRKLPGPEAAPRDESQAASERRAIEHTIRSLFARQKRSQALATLRELQLELRASSDPADKIKLAAINDALAERGVDSGPATGKARFVGQPTEIEAAGFDKPIPARYAVFSLDDLTPSHDFRTGLPRKNESYPAGLQPREYAKDSEEARKVIRFAAEQKAGFYLSTHPGADSGPPTADPDGVVINGNGRVMSLQVAAGPRGKQGNFDWYKGKLVEQAALFGLDPAAVSSLKRPVLVRVVDMAADSPEAKKFARAGNVSTTQSQSPVRTAASLNGLIDGELLDSIRLEDETTFSEAVSDPVAGRNFRHRLYRALPEAERARYFHEDGRLTEGGTELVRHMLLTKLLPVELVERLGEERRQLKRTIEGAIPQLLKAQRDLQEAKVPQYLGEALEFVVKHPEANTLRALDNTLAQGDLFKGKYASLSPVGKLFTAFLIEFGGKPLVFRKNVIGFIKDINMPLFGGEPSADEKAGEALDRLRQDQTAKQAEAKAGGPLFAGLDPKRPQPSEAQASIDALMSAFAAVEQGERTRNWVNLADLEAQLGWNRARFLAVLKAARQRGWLTLSAAEGKGGISDRDRKAGIYEDGALLLFASRKEGSAAEAAQRRADEATALAKAETERTSPMATLGGFGLGTGERQRADTVPLAIQAPSAEVEQRLQQARGIQPDSLASKIKAWATTAKNVLTRARQHLPNNAEFATANEVLRLLDAVPQQAGDEVSRTVAAIVDPLGPKQLQLFERKLIVDNLLASVDRGEPLRFGFESKAEVETYRQQLDALIEQLPAVQQALKTRAEVVREKVQQLVELDILDAEAARNPAYFHQQVLTKLQAQRLAGGGSAPQRIQRGFQKGRVSGIEALGEEFDYNTSYLEAEISWLTDAAVEAEKEKLFRRLATKYDIKPQLVEEAKQLGKDADWRDVLKDHPDHAVWSPEPGNTFYRAFTIPERVAEQLAQNVLFDMRLDPKDVGTALALTHPQRQFVLPKPLVAQLNETKKDQTSHAAAQVFEAGQSYWKVWRLFNPKSLRGYMTRNFFGDLDPVLTSVPGVLKYKLRAVQELWQYFYGRNLALSPALRQARNLAVIDGSLEVSEIPDLHELPVFKRLFRKDLSRTHLLLQAPAAWFKFAKRFNAFREASLRYAAFLYFRDQLRAGTLQHYGGARREVVDALAKDLGTDVAAAHLSRNLLGDYGNLTVLGQWLRKYVFPFWSFQEVQFKRWPRLAINAVQAGRLASKENALTAGALTALAALKLAVPYSLYWLWNNLRWPDEEQQLSAAERASPHIITGRNPDGSIRLLQRVSSQGEFLEWFGLDQLMQLLPLFRNEQITWGDVAQGVAKQPANKAFSALRPDVKGLFEVGGGLSFYPDAFNPQRQRRDDAFANIFGLADEARWARGQLGSTGERVRPGYGDRWAGITTSHPAKNALGEMFDLKDAFLKKQGKKPQERFGRSPIATMRDAAATNDHEAFREARQAYLADGHSYESFKRAIANLDPVAQLAGDPDLEGDSKKLKAADNLERKFVRQFLTDEQRTKLPIVRDYARRLEVTLWTWWQQASERDDSPEQRAAQQQAADKEILTAARRLASKKPVRVSEQAEWSHGIDSALDWLRRHDIDADRAEAAFREYLRKEVQTPAARQDALNRFRKTVRELEPRKEPTP